VSTIQRGSTWWCQSARCQEIAVNRQGLDVRHRLGTYRYVPLSVDWVNSDLVAKLSSIFLTKKSAAARCFCAVSRVSRA
jgi:hypothetical protein